MKIRAVLLSCLLLLAALPVYAEDGGPESLPIRVRATAGFIADADFEGGGSAQVTMGQARLKAGGLTLNYENRMYAWDDVDQLDFGNGTDDPWDSLHRISLGYEHRGRIDDAWSYMGAVTLTSSFEKEMDDSYGSALRGGVVYSIDDHWMIMAGGRVFINNIRTSAMPFLGVSYANYDEEGAGFFFGVGAPSSELGYAFSNTSQLRFNFEIDGRTYRLSDDSAVVAKGYVETSAMKLGLTYDWKPLKSLSISFGPEYYLERQMKFFTHTGNRYGDAIDQDGAYGGSLQVEFKF